MSEPDINHALRTAIRRVALDDDLTMLIGAGLDGRLLGTGRTPMPHTDTDNEIDHAAARFKVLADGLDPDTTAAEVTDDLRQVAAASEAVRGDEARLREAVQLARAHDRSWNQIAVALGVSRQAARQRFLDKTAV